jgi:hypothetical protein
MPTTTQHAPRSHAEPQPLKPRSCNAAVRGAVGSGSRQAKSDDTVNRILLGDLSVNHNGQRRRPSKFGTPAPNDDRPEPAEKTTKAVLSSNGVTYYPLTDAARARRNETRRQRRAAAREASGLPPIGRSADPGFRRRVHADGGSYDVRARRRVSLFTHRASADRGAKLNLGSVEGGERYREASKACDAAIVWRGDGIGRPNRFNEEGRPRW